MSPTAPVHPLPPVLQRLRDLVPDLWEDLAPLCEPLPQDEADAVAARLSGYLQDHAEHADHARELGNELLALHAGWGHFGPDTQAVLVGAMRYLLTSDDAEPDWAPGGLADDDRVVRACIQAILRGGA